MSQLHFFRFRNQLRTILLLALGTSGSVAADEIDPLKPVEWRVLLIIKAQGAVHVEGFPDLKYQMSSEDVAAAEKAFAEFTPEFVKTLSHGRLSWNPDVVVSPRPLTKVAKMGEGTWVDPASVADDIAEYAPLGKYDGVFVYWKGFDEKSQADLKGGFGWSIGPNDGANGGGYSCVNFVRLSDFGRESEWTEVFLHEWLHQLEAFYGGQGVKLPRGGLHGNDNYGFKHQGGWKHWYDAFITADLKEPDGTVVGLGEDAWRRGTIRDEVSIRTSDYLTPERLANNLLKNGSWEQGTKGWSSRSWKGKPKAFSTVKNVHHSGTASTLLKSDEPDDMQAWQKVSVKPHTRYLLGGWVRTEKVEVQQGGGNGATLSIWGGFEATRSVVGTQDWTYASLVFNSGDRSELELGPRLGHHSSIASGKAWFDDLVLIELPEVR